uniref:Uncharacterized protein n=1 Tax=Romanomermis culicivorax TaxID=13658 RepID=A0A915IMQ6_ROMCU
MDRNSSKSCTLRTRRSAMAQTADITQQLFQTFVLFDGQLIQARRRTIALTTTQSLMLLLFFATLQ